MSAMDAISTGATLSSAGVPSEVARVAQSDPAMTDSIESLRGALNDGATIVVLSGGVGVGKSVAAAWWLCRALASHDGRAWMRWVNAHHLARMASFDGHATLDDVENVDFLVLDDLGIEYLDGKGWLSSALDSIFYQRHGNRRLTVVTTNLGVRAFSARYGERVADRLRESGTFIEVSGASMRHATGKQLDDCA
jgi:DNA replication protein DnaC